MLYILIIFLILVSCQDIKSMIIHDFYNIAIAVLGIIYILQGGNTIYNGIFASLAGAAPLFIIDRLTISIAKKEGFGYGDMKLMLALGLFIGWIQAFFTLFFAVILASFLAGFLIYKRKKSNTPEKYEYMPFGPFLCIGFLLSYFGFHNFILY